VLATELETSFPTEGMNTWCSLLNTVAWVAANLRTGRFQVKSINTIQVLFQACGSTWGSGCTVWAPTTASLPLLGLLGFGWIWELCAALELYLMTIYELLCQC